MKKNKKIHASNSPKIYIGNIFFILVLIYCIITVGKGTIEIHRLKSDGKCAEAVVLYKNNIGSHGVIDSHYEFNVNGRIYNGSSDEENLAEIGDTIYILYLKSDPQINRSCSFLDIKCPKCK